MKFVTVTLALASLALAQYDDGDCPTATKSILNPRCPRQTCDYNDCSFVTTLQNPCGCPASIPTATLIAPCGADCPYLGCGIEFRTNALPCVPTTTSRTTRTRTTRPPITSSISTVTSIRTTTSSTTPTVSVGVTTLPPRPTTTSAVCPTVTRTTMPADCAPLRCPVPSCNLQEILSVPCGCAGPKTVLYVQGCQTACAAGCATRTQTVSATC